MDTPQKRRAALGLSTIVMPIPTGTIDAEVRRIFLRGYYIEAAIGAVVFTVFAAVELKRLVMATVRTRLLAIAKAEVW